jgi:hypothetical protein
MADKELRSGEMASRPAVPARQIADMARQKPYICEARQIPVLWHNQAKVSKKTTMKHQL